MILSHIGPWPVDCDRTRGLTAVDGFFSRYCSVQLEKVINNAGHRPPAADLGEATEVEPLKAIGLLDMSEYLFVSHPVRGLAACSSTPCGLLALTFCLLLSATTLACLTRPAA